MKKLVILLSLTCLLTTGCSIKKLDNKNIDNIVNTVLKSNRSQNAVFNGYSYYKSRGLKFLEKEDYNAILSDGYNNKYYLYVDVVSYYHRNSNTYKESEDSYYSKKIEGKKNGYLEINKTDSNKYFVEMVYNYSKIEVLSSKEHLNDTIVNVCTLLASVKYNDKILGTIIGDNVLNYEEESFNIFTTRKSDSNYLDYVEKYDSIYNSDNNVKDEDHIDLDSLD